MKDTIKALLVTCVFVVAMLVVIWAGMQENQKLADPYLNQTNVANHYVALFGVTNIGNVAVTSYGSGCIERFASNGVERVYCKTGLLRLQPGEGDIAKVFLPTATLKDRSSRSPINVMDRALSLFLIRNLRLVNG